MEISKETRKRLMQIIAFGILLYCGMEHFDVLTYPKLFHNLKAAIKEVCTEEKNRHIFYEDVPIPGSA